MTLRLLKLRWSESGAAPIASVASFLLIGVICCQAVSAGFLNVTSTVVPGLGDNKASWGDVNNDGFVDLQVKGVIYRNNAGSNFTPLASVDDDGLFVDYDNDGDLDFFSYHTKTMFANQGGTSFTQVNVPGLTGHQDLPTVSRGAAWSDHDNDGDLDLYISGFENASSSVYYADARFSNNGGTSFTGTWTQQIDTMVVPTNPRPGRGVTAADFNRDGNTDIYISNYRLEPNQLRVADGNGNFTEQAVIFDVVGGTANGHWAHSVGSAWGDFDNDGELDLFVGNFAHPAGWSGPQRQAESRFLKNNGAALNYDFDDLGTLGLPYAETYASPVLGDYDNDGDLDLFMTTINSTGASAAESAILYRNDGNWNFTDVTGPENLTGLKHTYQAAFADYDNDGDLDLVTGSNLYNNTLGNSNSWLKVKLVGDGVTVSRDAAGAQVRIASGGDTFVRQVEIGTGEGNQNDPTLHFGLGAITGTVDLDILWPGGSTSTALGLAVNNTHTVTFGVSELNAYQWIAAGSGNWHAGGNWSTGTIPNDSGDSVSFAGSASPSAQINVNQSTTVAELTLDSAAPHEIRDASGSATLRLHGQGQDARVNVVRGDHVLNIPVVAVVNTTFDVNGMASLSLSGPLDLNGRDVTKTGAGTLVVSGGPAVAAGSLQLNGGTLAGAGDINGNLNATAGVVAPGDGVGRMDVGGNFVLGNSAVLQTDLFGLFGNNDFVAVDGEADLAGSLEINLAPGFRPEAGKQFLVLAADTVVDSGISLGGVNASNFQLHVNANNVVLESLFLELTDDRTWNANGMGLWTDQSKWTPAVPDTADHTAIFGNVTSAPTTVVADTPVTVNAITFDHTVSYIVAGAGSVNLASDSSGGLPVVTVTEGDHQFQVEVNLQDNTELAVASGARLEINNRLGLDGNTLIKTGLGTLQINHIVDADGGEFDCQQGTCAGSGTVSGSFSNSAILSPGNSPGEMVVEGDFTQHAQGTLHLEIAGTVAGHEYDLLSVTGEATLDGKLEVVLLDSFEPGLGDRFDMLDFNAQSGDFAQVLLPALAVGHSWDTSRLYRDGSIGVVQTVVPEPSTLITGISLACLLAANRGSIV